MNNSIKKAYLTIAAVGLVLISAALASPVDAQVVFDPDPLFQEVEILPGDADPTPATITITNQTSDTRAYYLGAGVLSGATLADAIPLTVTGDAMSETLTVTELELDPLLLGDFAAGETRAYTVSASYYEDGAYLEQGVELRFVILVGTDDGEVVTSGGGSSGGGGSGGLLPPVLTILNTQVASIEATSLGYNVLITWLTNLSADSMVVFGPAGSTYTLDPGDTKLGYPEAVTLGGLRTGHGLLLSGLVPGEYVFRVASSEGGGYTTSPEYRFEITSTGELVPEVLGIFQSLPDTSRTTRPLVTPLERTLAEVRGAFQTRINEAIATGTVDESLGSTTSPAQAEVESATAGTAGLDLCSPRYRWLVVIVSLLVGLLGAGLVQRRRPRGRRQVPVRATWFATLLVAVLGYVFWSCTWWWVILAWLGILLLAWLLSRSGGHAPS